MTTFENLIAKESEILNRLHKNIHKTFIKRGKSKSGLKAWKEACQKCHSYKSGLDYYTEKACLDKAYSGEILEFVICFLEIDPWFFRSGYLKQVFITKLKRSDLTPSEINRTKKVLIKAVEAKGTREFKYYCRLASAIADEILIRNLKMIESLKDGAASSRARMMLNYIRRHGQMTFEH